MTQLRLKLFIIVGLLVVALVYVVPSVGWQLPAWWSSVGILPTEKIHLGLDLQGDMLSYSMPAILATLRPYSKFMSLACLSYVHLPVLPTFLFTDWNELVERRIANFCRRLSLDQVLIRSQAEGSIFGQSYSAIPINQVSRISQDLFGRGSKIVGLHPELSIHRDEYSVHVVFDFLSTLRVTLEIVGPGFAATHLSRASIVHERIHLSAFGSAHGSVGAKRLWSTSDDAYQRGVRKIIDEYGYDVLVDAQSLLLGHEHSYSPIPVSFIKYIHSSLDSMREAIGYMSLDSARAVVSMSFFRPVNSSVVRPVFWDIHELH